MDKTATAPHTFDVQRIRRDFPILNREMNGKPFVFLDSAASSQKPESVIRTIDRYYREQHANVHRGVYQLSQTATEAYERTRRLTRDFINAAFEREIIFVRGATEGINLVASSFGRKYLKEGDEVLITAMEHHSNIVPWQLICEQTGAVLRVVPITDAGELRLDAYDRLLSDRTRIVALVHVSNTLGTINPVKEMIRKAHERDIPVLVDGCQAAPHMQIDVQDLDADFYTFSGHKIFGPTGIGVLYGKEQWLDAMPPYHGGGEMIETVTFEKTTYNELPHKFEAGTPHIAGGVGLGAAIEYINGIGYEDISRHEADLLTYATERLQAIEGIHFYGTARHKASLISFLIEGVHPYDLGTLLDKQGIAVRTGHHCTQPLMDRFGIPGTVRASFAVYNTREDVDRLVSAIQRATPMLR